MHHRQKRLCTRSASFTFFEGFFGAWKSLQKVLFYNIASEASYLYFRIQLFVYISPTNVSCLFTLCYRCQLFIYIYTKTVSCLFTLCYQYQLFVYIMVPLSAVYLHLSYECQLCIYIYPMNVSCLFTLSYNSQLIVYIMVPMSAVCLHLNIARFARNVRKWDNFGNVQTMWIFFGV